MALFVFKTVETDEETGVSVNKPDDNYATGYVPQEDIEGLTFLPVSAMLVPRIEVPFVDPLERTQEVAASNIGQYLFNFGLSNELAKSLVDLEFEGLESFNRQARGLQQEAITEEDLFNQAQIARANAFNRGQIPQANLFNMGQLSQANAFNQQQRLFGLETALPGARDTILKQIETNSQLAEGRLPSELEDRAFEVASRSAAADSTLAGGFGVGSAFGQKTSDLLSAEKRLGLMQAGQTGLNNFLTLGSNLAFDQPIKLNPVMDQPLRFQPQSANLGSQIPGAPSVPASSLSMQERQNLTPLTTIQPATAIAYDINQNQFQANLDREADKVNATLGLDAAKFNSTGNWTEQVEELHANAWNSQQAAGAINAGIDQANMERITDQMIEAGQTAAITSALGNIAGVAIQGMLGESYSSTGGTAGTGGVSSGLLQDLIDLATKSPAEREADQISQGAEGAQEPDSGAMDLIKDYVSRAFTEVARMMGMSDEQAQGEGRRAVEIIEKGGPKADQLISQAARDLAEAAQNMQSGGGTGKKPSSNGRAPKAPQADSDTRVTGEDAKTPQGRELNRIIDERVTPKGQSRGQRVDQVQDIARDVGTGLSVASGAAAATEAAIGSELVASSALGSSGLAAGLATAAGVVGIGAAAYVVADAIFNFGSNKGKDQRRRDALRDLGKKQGIFTKKDKNDPEQAELKGGAHYVKLANGDYYNAGVDGDHKIENYGVNVDGKTKRYTHQIDWSDPRAGESVGLLNPVALMAFGDKNQEYMMGHLWNASISNNDSLSGTKANIKQLALNMGLDYKTGLKVLKQYRQAKALSKGEYAAYVNGWRELMTIEGVANDIKV